MRLMIVDEDEIAIELLREVLLEAGYEVDAAQNGCEALEMLRTGLYGIVISDWELPTMNGIDLCRNIRARHFSSYVYIILLTCRNGTKHVVEALNAGADDFIAKPFHPAELCVRVLSGKRMLSPENRAVTIFTMAKLAEPRSLETGAHLDRVREYCQVLAAHLSGRDEYRDAVD